MSERKVLNKYYPPDFDPTKIPRSKVPRSDTFAIRVMAPFNMRCNNCGEYIYKGKKFNSRKETVQDEFYLGLRIFRFYIKCPRCVSEIAFKTDLENTDYTLEAGATRNFEAQRTAEMLAKKEMEEKEEEDKNNPMKVLENRTKASRDEMTMLETLEDLKEMNAKNSQLDTERMVEKYRIYEQELQRLQDEEDEKVIRSIFSKTEDGGSVKRLLDGDDDRATKQPPLKFAKPTDFLVDDASVPKTKKYDLKAMKKNKPKALRGLVVKRKPAQAETHQQDSQQTQPAASTATTTSLSDKSAASETTGNVNSVQDESITSNISSSSSAEHGSDSDNSALKTSDTSATASTSATTISNASADSTSAVAKSSSTSTGSTTASASIGLGSSGLGLLGDYASSSSDDSD